MIAHLTKAQTLCGRVIGPDNKPIMLANVVVKSSDTSQSILEFVAVRKGSFELVLSGGPYPHAIAVEAVASGFFGQSKTIKTPHPDSIYTFTFTLATQKEAALPEVVIKAKKMPVRVHNDTTTYQVSAFGNGSERKIGEVIAQMPGIEIDSKSGKIIFKGKEIETILLEGDNLFDQNYSIGSKNINVDAVDKVEAIENYSANPLLRGIEKGGKMVLNLKLKKNRADISADVSSALGLNTDPKLMADLSTNLLAITSKYKGFGTFSFNNIGTNYSPFDYFSMSEDKISLLEDIRKPDKLINQNLPGLGLNLDQSRININQAWFGNLNMIQKISPKFSIKTNLYYLKDKLYTRSFEESENNFANQKLVLSGDQTAFRCPQQYRLDMNMNYNLSAKSSLEYNFKISDETINTPTQIVLNRQTNFQTYLKTKQQYISQDILFTRKMKGKNALQISLAHYYEDIKQRYDLGVSVLDTAVYSADRQIAGQGNAILASKAIWLGRKKGLTYNVSAGTKTLSYTLNTRLSGLRADGLIQDLYANQGVLYTQNRVYQAADVAWGWRKFKFGAEYNMSLLSQQLSNALPQATMAKQTPILEPLVSVGYSLGRYGSLGAEAGYTQKPLAQDYVFTNPVLTDARSLQTNSPTLDFEKSLNYSLSYLYNNLEQLTNGSLVLMYNKARGSVFSEFMIGQRVSMMRNFFLAQNTENISLLWAGKRYFDVLRSFVGISGNYSFNNSRNIINGSQLRNIFSQTLRSGLEVKSVFASGPSFENKIMPSYSKSKSENGPAFENMSLNNRFKVFGYLHKNLLIVIESDLYLPNTKKMTENIHFIDLQLVYKSDNKRHDWRIDINNILNNKNFTQIQTSDFFIGFAQSSLQPCFGVLSYSWSF